MVAKKTTKVKAMRIAKAAKPLTKAKGKTKKALKKTKTVSTKDLPTLQLKKESEIAMDFALKVYQKFEKSIKSIILFGSTAKQTSTPSSDIDVIIILDQY